MAETILKVDQLSKKFSKSFTDSLRDNFNNIFLPKERTVLHQNEFWSLKNIDLKIQEGEIVGIIGANGCGKTTLMRIISGIYRQDKGKVQVNGRIAAIFALKSGMHPHLSGLENIFIKASLYGMTKEETDHSLQDIINFSGLGEYMDRPFGVYSSGMKAKLAFAILTAVKPKLFIIDEGLAVGDIAYQAKCFQYLKDQQKTMTTIYITNQHNHLENFASRILIMDKGEIVGDTTDLQDARNIYARFQSMQSEPKS